MSAAPEQLTIASFNIHAGVDGWGRPFDVVEACKALDADVIALQEVWSPVQGDGLATQVANALGYQVHEYPLAQGRRARPEATATARWMPSLDWRSSKHAIFLDNELPYRSAVTASERFMQGELGSWNIALLSRLPVVRSDVIDLGRLARDRARRAALVNWFEVGGQEVGVVGTHMSHITHGSLVHYLRLGRALRETLGESPSVIAGDMNLWGPPASLFLRGWSRAVKGRTWPGWRPHSQLDHIFVHNLDVITSRVIDYMGSDHRGVRATLAVRQTSSG